MWWFQYVPPQVAEFVKKFVPLTLRGSRAIHQQPIRPPPSHFSRNSPKTLSRNTLRTSRTEVCGHLHPRCAHTSSQAVRTPHHEISTISAQDVPEKRRFLTLPLTLSLPNTPFPLPDRTFRASRTFRNAYYGKTECKSIGTRAGDACIDTKKCRQDKQPFVSPALTDLGSNGNLNTRLR